MREKMIQDEKQKELMPDDGSISQEYIENYKLALDSFPFDAVEKAFVFPLSQEAALEINRKSKKMH